jgi:hypothetical protein
MYRSHLGTTTDWAVSCLLLSAVSWGRFYADPVENGRGHSVSGSSSDYTPWNDTMIVNNEAGKDSEGYGRALMLGTRYYYPGICLEELRKNTCNFVQQVSRTRFERQCKSGLTC